MDFFVFFSNLNWKEKKKEYSSIVVNRLLFQILKKKLKWVYWTEDSPEGEEWKQERRCKERNGEDEEEETGASKKVKEPIIISLLLYIFLFSFSIMFGREIEKWEGNPRLVSVTFPAPCFSLNSPLRCFQFIGL